MKTWSVKADDIMIGNEIADGHTHAELAGSLKLHVKYICMASLGNGVFELPKFWI